MTSRDETEHPAPAAAQRRKLLHDLLDDLWNGLSERAGAKFLTSPLHVPLDEGPALLGIDPLGLPHLLLPIPLTHKRGFLIKTEGVRLEIRSLVLGDQPQSFLDLSCRKAELTRVFLSLTADTCAELLADATDPVGLVTRLVEEWRELFGSGAGKWSRVRCASTFAELIVLRRILKSHPGASSTWVGPSGAAQDFRSPGHAVEVKSTLSPERRIATVNGWDQLDPPTRGSLHLVWFRLEESDDGMTLREALSEALKLSGGASELLRMTSELALPDAPDPEVDGIRFAAREELFYKVDENFPAVVPSSFRTGAVPAGVVRMTYSIDLNTVAVEAADVLDRVLDDLAAAL